MGGLIHQDQTYKLPCEGFEIFGVRIPEAMPRAELNCPCGTRRICSAMKGFATTWLKINFETLPLQRYRGLAADFDLIPHLSQSAQSKAITTQQIITSVFI